MSTQLRQLAKTEQTTVYAVMLSAFALLLSRYSGQDDFAIGTQLASRRHTQLKSLVGFLVQTIVVRTALDSKDCCRDLIANTHRRLSQVQKHQDIPFDQLVDLLKIKRDPSHNPIFQVMFGVQHFDFSRVDGSVCMLPPSTIQQETAAWFDLKITVDDKPSCMLAQLDYPVALFQSETIERLWQHYVEVLEQFVAQPDGKIRNICLADWRDTRETEITGRTDQTIKINGYHVTLTDIENTLTSLDGVREAIVLPADPGTSESPSHLVAWYLADQILDPLWLHEQLGKKIPLHMIPEQFIPIAAVRPKAGRSPDYYDQLRLETVEASLPEMPRTALEYQLSELWQQLLDVDQPGVHENFFNLGGNSLLATRLCRIIGEETGKELSLPAFFINPTIAAVARIIENQG